MYYYFISYHFILLAQMPLGKVWSHLHPWAIYLQQPVELICMFLGCGKKAEYVEKTHTESANSMQKDPSQPAEPFFYEATVMHHCINFVCLKKKKSTFTNKAYNIIFVQIIWHTVYPHRTWVHSACVIIS